MDCCIKHSASNGGLEKQDKHLNILLYFSRVLQLLANFYLSRKRFKDKMLRLRRLNDNMQKHFLNSIEVLGNVSNSSNEKTLAISSC